jgi:hypothetical protein
MKLSKFSEDLGRFQAVFFRNCHNLANSSTCNMIPIFSTPLFVFVARFGQTLLWLLGTFGAT